MAITMKQEISTVVFWKENTSSYQEQLTKT